MFNSIEGIPVRGLPIELGPHALTVPFLVAAIVCGMLGTFFTTGGRSAREAGKGLYAMVWLFAVAAGIRPAL